MDADHGHHTVCTWRGECFYLAVLGVDLDQAALRQAACVQGSIAVYCNAFRRKGRIWKSECVLRHRATADRKGYCGGGNYI